MKSIVLAFGIVLLVLICSLENVYADEETGEQPLESPPSVSDGEEGDAAEDDDLPEVPEGMVRENVMKWSTPTLSDEEAHSTRLPSNLKCDGCVAINYQIVTGMAMFHERKYRVRGKMAPESEVIELMEMICDKKSFENYGLKQMNGENRLSGPGTDAADEPGMMQGGGKWPHRLHMMCGEIVGEMDEYEIYKVIANEHPNDLFSKICEDENNETLGSCVGLNKGKKWKAKKQKENKKKQKKNKQKVEL